MEAILTTILNSGNVVAIVCFIICYLVIYFQRKNTAAARDAATMALEQEIAKLKTEKELMKKDIENLKNEHSDIKES